ncbi:MAG: outer rane autotransporter barrel domain [Rariglobus sp.]|nr:outer rane autotransporter barrel domain [Rariglobus sp.]
MKSPSSSSPRLRRAIALLALPALSTPAVFAGAFLHTGAGPYEYTSTANWGSSVIGNNWTTNIVADQTITFATDYTTADQDGASSGSTSTLSIANTGTFNHTFIGGGANRTLTLGGNITLGNGGATANKVIIGSLTAGQQLNLDLGAASRTFTIGTNRTLEILNVVSGATRGITTTGNGKLILSNEASTYGGATALQSGAIVEVTKLANGGVNSSIGTANATTSSLVFGGSSAATLRYVGGGDTTNRLFSVGGAGGMIDSSGSGALVFNATGSLNLITSGTARTITFKGTNTDDNSISIVLADAGSGKTTIQKDGAGKWILSGNNTYTGDTIINAGTLQLGSANSGGNGGNVILNGGTFATGGFSETFGTLDVNGNAIIDMGNLTSALVFADSSLVAWSESVSLSIINYTGDIDSIFFGVDGLDLSQLAKITINGFDAALENGFLVVAIPEPSTYAFLAGAGGLLLAGVRRRTRVQ